MTGEARRCEDGYSGMSDMGRNYSDGENKRPVGLDWKEKFIKGHARSLETLQNFTLQAMGKPFNQHVMEQTLNHLVFISFSCLSAFFKDHDHSGYIRAMGLGKKQLQT